MKPYYIYAPPFNWSSAGIIVMHRLANELRKKGMEVYINVHEQNPNYEPIPVPDSIDVHNSIAVYPEIVWGNPYGADVVVRYILHIPGYWGGPKEFDENDLLFVVDDEWNRVSNLNLPPERVLAVRAVEEVDFPNYGWERDRDYFLVGKGKNLGLHPKDAIDFGERTAFQTPEQRKALVDNLNRCRNWYSYDVVCALNEIAALCGANITMYQDISDIKYRPPKHLFEDGIREVYKKYNEIMYRQLDKFIEITQGV